jgi:predicted peptidase
MAKMLKKRTYATDNVQNGWSREYLAQIGDIIRRMIKEGTVNPERVYVTGMSMGGAGTLYALSTIGDLFAAAVCICPTINPEIYGILTGLTHTKIWVACAYLDHLYYRHKYCTDGVMALRDGGNKDAHLTIFSPEDMEKYSISVLDDMTLAEKAAWNHACWVPTYYNEYGIMSWMMDQRKN